MAAQGVEIAVDDNATRQLARFLLVSEIAAQVLTCYLIVEMIERGQLSYLISWHWQKWKAKVDRERKIQGDLRHVLWQAGKILEETNG